MNIEIEVLDDETTIIEWYRKILDGYINYPFYCLNINNFINGERYNNKIEVCTTLKIFKMKSLLDNEKSISIYDLYIKLNTHFESILMFYINDIRYIMNDIKFFIRYKNNKPILSCHKEDINIFINKVSKYDDAFNIFEEYKYYKGNSDLILHRFENNRREENTN